MAIKFERIKEGMTLYDVRKSKLAWNPGNFVYWEVRVFEVNTTDRTVLASWNGNTKEWMPEWRITKFRAKLPKGCK